MKCPLCHSEDTRLDGDHLCCHRCNSRFLLDSPISTPQEQGKPGAFRHDKLDSLLAGGLFMDLILSAMNTPSTKELDDLISDVERGVNRP